MLRVEESILFVSKVYSFMKKVLVLYESSIEHFVSTATINTIRLLESRTIYSFSVI